MADTVELLNQPMDPKGWAAEKVTLERGRNGDVAVVARTSGRVIETYVGEGVREYVRRWTVGADQVPRVIEALSGVEESALLEALREVIGTQAGDEGTTIGDRFAQWLTARGIPHKETDETIPEP